MESLPAHFKQQIQTQLGDQYPRFIESMQKLPPTSIRRNPKKIDSLNGANVPWTGFGHYLPERPVFTLDPLFHAGTYYVQEASSMFLEHAIVKSVDRSLPLKALDLCASPGGKTTHLLSLLNDESFVVSNEVIRSRASILSENVQKWGYPNCLVTSNDPADFSSLTGFFDLMVIDAPCSGEGLFRKDPLAVDQWSPENVSLCAARQTRILHDIWPSLREGGVLIYCTCTFNPSENEDNLDTFSKEYEMEFIDLSPPGDWGVETIKKNSVIGYRFFPHRVNGEGFFLSAMRKKAQEQQGHPRLKKKLNPAPKKIAERLADWITRNDFSFHQHQDLVFALPGNRTEDVDRLLQCLHFVYGGTNIATVKHEKLIPEHALAVSTIVNQNALQVLDADEKTALQYLRREAVSFPQAERGFSLVRFKEIPLGWVNVLENRSNNLYPQEWRIRMTAL